MLLKLVYPRPNPLQDACAWHLPRVAIEQLRSMAVIVPTLGLLCTDSSEDSISTSMASLVGGVSYEMVTP